MKKQFITDKILKENRLKVEKSIVESFAKNFNKIKRLNENELNEELYDFISDFKRTEGRPPTKDEIEKLYYGRGNTSSMGDTKPNKDYVEFPQSGPDGIYVGDTVKNKKSGELFTIVKPPYRAGKWSDNGRYMDYFKAIDIKDENGKVWRGDSSNYEKVHTEDELTQKAGIQSAQDKIVDMISQKLIDGGFFDSEIVSGKMFDSFTRGKKQHNEDIRNAITKIGKENPEIPKDIIEKYWDKFW
jgi:hypothetical protein